MLRFLRETWLPAAVFAAVGIWWATIDRDPIHYAGGIASLIVVPAVWKWFVIRQGRPRVRRAALAGSASAFLIMWSDAMISSVRQFIHQGRHASEELGGLLVIFVPIMTIIGFVLGAGIATVVALVQARLWPGPPEEPGTAAATLDGAVGGPLVATVIAPFAAIFVVPLMPNQRAPGMNLLTATAGTWLVLACAGAWLGVRAVRRWRRIHDQGGASHAGPRGAENTTA